jgi:hypothetical protein
MIVCCRHHPYKFKWAKAPATTVTIFNQEKTHQKRVIPGIKKAHPIKSDEPGISCERVLKAENLTYLSPITIGVGIGTFPTQPGLYCHP